MAGTKYEMWKIICITAISLITAGIYEMGGLAIAMIALGAMLAFVAFLVFIEDNP